MVIMLLKQPRQLQATHAAFGQSLMWRSVQVEYCEDDEAI